MFIVSVNSRAIGEITVQTCKSRDLVSRALNTVHLPISHGPTFVHSVLPVMARDTLVKISNDSV